MEGNGKMKIIRVLNTNAVVTVDKEKREVIVTGAGIGFRKKKGEFLDKSLIDRIYRLQSDEGSKKLQEYVQAVSEEYLDIAEKVVQTAIQEEKLEVNDILYVTLTDHINSVLERAKSGIMLKNIIKADIQNFYPKEFSIGNVVSLIADLHQPPEELVPVPFGPRPEGDHHLGEVGGFAQSVDAGYAGYDDYIPAFG